MRRKQPEVEPYCACESCACCGSVAVRRVGARAWPGGPWAAGAGLCEGRAGCGPVRGEGRANAGPGAGQREARAGPLLGPQWPVYLNHLWVIEINDHLIFD